ncbi:hypothetical protein BpHYR1_048046 [Brachionus plicatilis]|uniref:Uncharacterized protein n=1 Tax=Brachionus plicatilis TaxID=10195 RepID=A0A3M7Q398_BRAPC|nr:hypothetical protein BpHYR1_048046 [Brachionus plicatilis]
MSSEKISNKKINMHVFYCVLTGKGLLRPEVAILLIKLILINKTSNTSPLINYFFYRSYQVVTGRITRTVDGVQQAGMRRRLTTEAVYGSCFALTLENSCCIDLFDTCSEDGAAVSAVIKE